MKKLLSTALALAAAAALAPLANAAPSLTPAGGNAKFPERAFVLTLPAGAEARASQINVTENGGPVRGLDVEAADTARRSQLGVVLVLDTSNSMRGQPLDHAFAAAREFARERNEQQRLSVVTFNSQADVAMPLTTDPFVIQESLAQPPETRAETHLYDAGLKAIDVIRQAELPGGFVVVLSDGADFGSEASASAVAAAARDAHVRIYTVGLNSPKFDPTSLTELAESGGGNYAEAASPADLSTIYSRLSAELSNSYLVRYRSLAEPRAKVAVTANVSGVGSASAAYTAPHLAVSNPGGSDGSTWSSPVVVGIAVAVIAALFALSLVALVRRRRKTARERVEEFVAARDAEPEAEPTLTDRLASTTERSLAGSARWERFSESVDIARISSSPASLLTNTMLGAAAAGLLLAAATGQLLIPIVLVALAPFVLSAVIRSRVRRQRRLFSDQLADHLAVVGSTLRGGHSFAAALASGLEDAPQPTRREFERVLADEHLGAPLDEALEAMGRRMESRDIEQVSLLALLQREAGADAAEMLDGVVESIRERQKLQRTVRTLTAQGRFSRTILTLLPIGAFGFLMATNPDYVDPLLNTDIGRILIGLGVVMVIAGSLVIKRIVEFEI
jgi:tight adherence protein B